MNEKFEHTNLPIYLNEITTDLLEKFGKGSHKPGSGSAAAFSGMIASKLLLTVISLTLDKKRSEKYGSSRPVLAEIKQNIDTIIFPKLSELFQEDCKVFHKVVNARIKRDEEPNKIKAAKIQRIVDDLMVEAIEIPFEIANLCVELSKYALQVFDLGWKAVRGDSGVAIEKSVSALGGSSFVITLNLSHLTTLNEFSKSSVSKLKIIDDEYENLKIEIKKRHQQLNEELKEKIAIQNSLDLIRGEVDENQINDFKYIENIVRKIQKSLWNFSNLNNEASINDRLKLFDAKKVLKNLGYNVVISKNLGTEFASSKYKEIAGVCDNVVKFVGISNFYTKEIQRFTLAHELGHAMLHKKEILFRDLPLDGSNEKGEYLERDSLEVQANKFAAFFLMPKKMVEEEFKQRFGFSQVNKAIFKETFNIHPKEDINLRRISRQIASQKFELFGNSIANQFLVSVEAMAIRLEELKIVVD